MTVQTWATCQMVTSLSLPVCKGKQITTCLWNEWLSGVLAGAGWRKALNSDCWEVIDKI